jgi:polar amino acid transport system substrate-binding protein
MRKLLIVLMIFALCSSALFAKDYKAAVKQLPGVSDFFVSSLKAVVEATGNTVTVQIVPPARADYLVSTNEVDIQCPIIVMPDPTKQKNLKYDYSTASTYKIAFVFYCAKNKTIDMGSIKKGNPSKYNIEVDPSRMEEFDFKVIPSSNFEASLKKIESGAIDGAIFAQTIADPILKNLKLKNVKRQLWFEYDNAYSIQKGTRGGEVDKMLVKGIAALKSSGKYDEIFGAIAKASKYDNWQQ